MKKDTEITKVKNPQKLSSFFKSEALVLFIITVSGLIFNFGMLANPFFQGRLVDSINTLSPQDDLGSIITLVLVYIAVIFVIQLSRAIKRYYVRKFAYTIQNSIRLNVYNNILNEEESQLKEEKIGTLISRTISDVNSAVEGMRKLTTEIFDTVILFIIYIAYLFMFDSKVTILSLIPVFAAIFVAFLLRKLIYSYSAKARRSNSALASKTYDLFDNALLYRIYGRDDDNLKEYDSLLDDYEKNNRRAQVLKDTMIPFVNTIALLGLIPLLYLTIPYVIEGKELSVSIIGFDENVWTIGLFTTYLSSFVLMANKASHTARLFSSIETGLACWKRIGPYIKEYKPYEKGTTIEGDDKVVFNNFSLIIDDKTLIKDLNFEAKKGEIIGVTGPIASGKSALGKVLIGLLPYQGSLTVFNQEVSSNKKEDLQKTVVYMGHQPQLFTDTIAKNIAFDGTKEVLPYLEDVAFYEDLESMPDKEETLVGNEGVKLSGGQQQRLALARTLYHQKPILVLDDPFSNVDIKTEKEILSNLKERTKDSLVFLISHRLTAFVDMEKILVLNTNGKVDQGSHEYLLEHSAVYKEIYQIQKEAKEVKGND